MKKQEENVVLANMQETSMIEWSRKLKVPYKPAIMIFLQQQVNRLIVGHVRYSNACVSQKYLTRLSLELKAYKKSGNREQLINIANYALLESLAPENKKFHYDNTVDSATREKVL